MDELQLSYCFTTLAAPVQVEGFVAGRPFYFRARHKHWPFAVSERDDINPVLINTPERGAVRLLCEWSLR